MSSLSLSAVEALLRVTVALPVTVATFPIGSSAAGCAAVGADAGALCGAGAGCTCAKAPPAVARQHSRHAANETRCLATSAPRMISRRLRTASAERPVNVTPSDQPLRWMLTRAGV